MPRSSTIGVVAWIAALACPVAPVRAQERGENRAAAPAQPNPAAAQQAQMEWLLNAWAGQAAKLKTLDVHIQRIDKTPAWNEEIHYQGRAVFKRPELAYLDFKKVKDAAKARGKMAPPIHLKQGPAQAIPFETIICNGKEVWQYLYDVRQIFVYPLDKEQRKRALDEGPLPFLFNMKVADAQRRYGMSFEGADPKSYLVAIQPRLQEDKESFKTAWIVLDRQFLLPLRILLLAPDGKSTRDFRLSDHRANAEIDDRYFQGGVPDGKKGDPRRPWKVVRNPDAQGRPRAQGAAADRQPALRGDPPPRR